MNVGLNFTNANWFNTPTVLNTANRAAIAGGSSFSVLPQASIASQPSQFSLANSVNVQSNPLMMMMNMMMQMMQMMMGLFTGNFGNTNTATNTNTGTQATNTNTSTNATAGGASTGVTSGAGGSTTATAGGAGTGTINTQMSVNDLANYVLGQTQGGTAGVDENISSVYMQQNSRLANAGANEFDAAVAQSYSAQFKAYAMDLPVAFSPDGNVSVNKIAQNLSIAQGTEFTPEAEMLSKVAAIYRGEFGGVGRYDNAELKNLLVAWGRNDIASQPGVGNPQGDVQSIGGVVKALNEEPSQDVRQAWLQQVFDFQGGTGVSPSGAVPQSQEYQFAIDMVNSGTYDQLLNNFNNDIKTSAPMTNATQPPADQPAGTVIDTSNNGGNANTNNNTSGSAYGNTGVGNNGGNSNTDNKTPVTKPTDPTNTNLNDAVDAEIKDPGVSKNINIRQLNSDQRDAIGVSAEDRAIIHMWGRQVAERGVQNGDYYLTGGAGDVEAKLIKQFKAKEMAEFGKINGSALDEAFFEVNDRLHGLDAGTTASRYANRDLHDTSGIATTFRNDIAANKAEGGLTKFEQASLRLWGHQAIITQDGIDGSILGYTIGNEKALDSNTNSTGNAVDAEARTLLEADLLGDGVRNGDSLRSSFTDIMDKVYNIDGNGNGRIGTSAEAVMSDAEAKAAERAANGGTSLAKIAEQAKAGVTSAIKEGVSLVKDHPAVAAAGGAALVAATAACPFLGGVAVGGAAIGMANKAFNS